MRENSNAFGSRYLTYFILEKKQLIEVLVFGVFSEYIDISEGNKNMLNFNNKNLGKNVKSHEHCH